MTRRCLLCCRRRWRSESRGRSFTKFWGLRRSGVRAPQRLEPRVVSVAGARTLQCRQVGGDCGSGGYCRVRGGLRGVGSRAFGLCFRAFRPLRRAWNPRRSYNFRVLDFCFVRRPRRAPSGLSALPPEDCLRRRFLRGRVFFRLARNARKTFRGGVFRFLRNAVCRLFLPDGGDSFRRGVRRARFAETLAAQVIFSGEKKAVCIGKPQVLQWIIQPALSFGV